MPLIVARNATFDEKLDAFFERFTRCGAHLPVAARGLWLRAGYMAARLHHHSSFTLYQI
jgi:hypothetical protein